MSPGSRSQGLGEAWESRAADFLADQGMTIIARRYRCRMGELDIVASDGEQLVIVEVKARGRDGKALEAIGSGKRRRIINATRHFLMRHSDWYRKPIRFDVIAFDRIDTDHPQFQWVRNAFDTS